MPNTEGTFKKEVKKTETQQKSTSRDKDFSDKIYIIGQERIALKY